ncbi:hypothetical protein [Pedobacter soli]|uniref:Uncharacterized protein n=1 Tax=Pedobacter soli TaxID=390242 RepID=A0A1G6ZDL3_9SPHI|nr:hypothetical protein [Pedobacter soli]SDE00704.1 hypothetical protein SAMN04488024_11068 [Pedobacter soli]
MARSFLKKYPKDQRLFKSERSGFEGWRSNSCIFGIPHYNNPLPSIDKLPGSTTSVFAYFAEGNFEIIENLIERGLNEQLEHLVIGSQISSYQYGFKNYARISELLSRAEFPKLKTFVYGDEFLLANQDAYYPYLGDVSAALGNMPALERLKLYGVFALSSRVNLPKLVELGIHSYWVTDEQLGFISQATLDLLLSSGFESLETLEIDLICNYSYDTDGAKQYYQLDEQLFLNFRALNALYICGYFKAGTTDRLTRLLSAKIQKLSLEDINES